MAQQKCLTEQAKYCSQFTDLKFPIAEAGPYMYFLSPAMSLGGAGMSDPDRKRAHMILLLMGLAPHVTGNRFLALAVGNIDSDVEFDIWAIDEQQRLIPILNDVP